MFFETIDSTQKEIWRESRKNKIKNGTIIIANVQTAGVGTHGRIWHTDTPNNIAFSLYLEVNCKIKLIEDITINIANTLVRAIREIYNIELDIKYPNDLTINGKKIAGILTETKVQNKIVKKIVIGIGINTNQEIFAQDIKDIASSIKKEYGISVENEKIVIRFLELFEKLLLENNIIH